MAKKPESRCGARQREEIADSIEMILALVAPIQSAVLSKKPLSAEHVAEFLKVLTPYIRNGIHWRSETSINLLARTVGLACFRLLFTYVADIGADQVEAMVSMISSDRFGVHQKLQVLEQLARRPSCHALAGQFAQHVSEQQ